MNLRLGCLGHFDCAPLELLLPQSNYPRELLHRILGQGGSS